MRIIHQMAKKKLLKDPVKPKSEFEKRIHCLFKKVHELSVLCRAQVCLIVEDDNNKTSYCYKNDSGRHSEFTALEYKKLNVDNDKVKVYNPSTGTFHNKLESNFQSAQPGNEDHMLPME
ncbi:uncharacterized protein LOC131037577 [Cryptomeria japonica]|uniref:uncharacterized protein LOC131037577 n=1 Tax=Cryptomeria japonica TaxID=3369 RepID=UPI0025AC2A74|nr:uncharacterized protein LOC131037577 [Cryptomeria japonica]